MRSCATTRPETPALSSSSDMPAPDRRTVRRLQRRYLEQWVDLLAELTPDAPRGGLRAAAHATFGLLNSTPHSAGALDRCAMARLLNGMAQGRPGGCSHYGRSRPSGSRAEQRRECGGEVPVPVVTPLGDQVDRAACEIHVLTGGSSCRTAAPIRLLRRGEFPRGAAYALTWKKNASL